MPGFKPACSGAFSEQAGFLLSGRYLQTAHRNFSCQQPAFEHLGPSRPQPILPSNRIGPLGLMMKSLQHKV
jgi:hypothetical protein